MNFSSPKLTILNNIIPSQGNKKDSKLNNNTRTWFG